MRIRTSIHTPHPSSRRHALRALAALGVASLWASPGARAHGAHGNHGPDGGHGAAAGSASALTRSLATVTVPDATLKRETGQATALREVLATPEAVLLNFIYTSCTTVCPVQTQVFAQVLAKVQAQRAKGGAGVRLVSVSIDPLHDTPERLAAYARQFGAGPQWHFLTGTPQASQAVQRAFDTWRGDKMNHPLVTFVRPAGAQRWVRLEGHATATDLLRELRAPAT